MKGLLVCLICLLSFGCSATTAKKKTDADTHYMLGVSYLREGDATKALKEFMLAVEADPQNKDAQAALGQAYQLKKAYPKAEEHYRKALELAPDDPQVENNLGDLYLTLQNWDAAIEQFRRASSNLLFSKVEVPLTGMGVAYSHKGLYLDAIEAFHKALKANPRYPLAHFYLGEAYYALNKIDLAIESYQEAIKLVPDYVQAHYRLAMSYMRQEKPGLARQSFAKVVALAPDSEPGLLAKDYLKLIDK